MDRRRFLKYAGTTAALVGVSALGLDYLVNQTNQKMILTSTTSSSLMAQTSSILSNAPLAVKDLTDQITPFHNDLSDFAESKTDPHSLKNGSDLYTKLISHTEGLKASLKDYRAQNSETAGQVIRLDQIALGALYLYSWTSRMLEDDFNVAHNVGGVSGNTKTSSIGNNLSLIRYPVGQLYRQLVIEINADAIYKENTGKALTDVATETLTSPRNRPRFKSLYEILSPDAKSRLKQLLESSDSGVRTISDYKNVTDEDIAIASFNILLSQMPEGNESYVQILLANAAKRKSTLGEIVNRGNTLWSEREIT